MQGKLSEIDIRSILQLIELGQRTGELFVEAYPSQSGGGNASILSLQDNRASGLLTEQYWFVFCLNGQIVYAADSDTSLSRLSDYLQRYRPETALTNLTTSSAIASISAPEYGYLWALLENHILTPAEGRNIIRCMVHETLFDLLSLHQGAFIFEGGSALSPQLSSLEITPLLVKTMKQIQEWKQLHPLIQSPDQCPVIASETVLREILSRRTFNSLDRYTDGKTSIRQIARYLNRDILTVARAIYPHIQTGAIQLIYPSVGQSLPGKQLRSREFEWWQEARPPRIVCIDDGVTVRETVEHSLRQHGYEVTSIGNPLETFSLVFRLKPDLILCDITMPELDGYEICAMLRKSTAFREIPIIMLTGKHGFIDRVRAKMVGATDYLTKPFGESELLMLVEKYVGPGQPGNIVSSQPLVNPSNDGLEIDRTNATSATSTPFSQ
jgi:twitching motility two-component system response regulator PilG